MVLKMNSQENNEDLKKAAAINQYNSYKKKLSQLFRLNTI